MHEGKISAAMELESTTLRISYPGAIILPEVEQVPGVYRLVLQTLTMQVIYSYALFLIRFNPFHTEPRLPLST